MYINSAELSNVLDLVKRESPDALKNLSLNALVNIACRTDESGIVLTLLPTADLYRWAVESATRALTRADGEIEFLRLALRSEKDSL